MKEETPGINNNTFIIRLDNNWYCHFEEYKANELYFKYREHLQWVLAGRTDKEAIKNAEEYLQNTYEEYKAFKNK